MDEPIDSARTSAGDGARGAGARGGGARGGGPGDGAAPRAPAASELPGAHDDGARPAGSPPRHPVVCGCGVTESAKTEDRKAVGVEPEIRKQNLDRLRRIEGQVRGLQRMIEEDRYCADILNQVSSVHEALRAVGRELMRNHLRHCATAAIRAGEAEAEAMYDELMELMYRHIR